MLKRCAVLRCLVSPLLAHAGGCDTSYGEKSSVGQQVPKFDQGPLDFIIQPLSQSEVDAIEMAWKDRTPTAGDDRSTDFERANKRALAELDLGRTTVLRTSLNGPQALVRVPTLDELCKLVKQPRVVRLWMDRKVVAPTLAPLSGQASRN